MSLQARAQSLHAKLMTFNARAAVHNVREAQALTVARSKKLTPRALAKLEQASQAAGIEFYQRSAGLRVELETFARDAIKAGHSVTAVLCLLDAHGDSVYAAIKAARAELRAIELTEGIRKPPSAEEAKKQRALELWNNGMKWTDVAEAVDGTPEYWRPLQQEIRRFAAANNLPMRKGTPGAKRLT
jgi:hypothetical protein